MKQRSWNHPEMRMDERINITSSYAFSLFYLSTRLLHKLMMMFTSFLWQSEGHGIMKIAKFDRLGNMNVVINFYGTSKTK